MPGDSESAAYLGGIGTMVSQSDVCPTCGEEHKTRRFGLRVVRESGCPVVVLGSFPVFTEHPAGHDSVSEGLTVPEARGSERNEPIVVPFFSSRKGSSLAIPWPAPPLTEDYL
ncbi:MAG: hypothetical protein L3K23_03050 [Thermoplasmata archaeon]|nr:hypothetical protein [Thermoplasmata archaeon]